LRMPSIAIDSSSLLCSCPGTSFQAHRLLSGAPTLGSVQPTTTGQPCRPVRGDKNAVRPERFGSNRRGPSIPMDMLASFCLLRARAAFCVCISYNCPDRPVIPDSCLGSRCTRGAVAARLIDSL
jgi:hypothetical protein